MKATRTVRVRKLNKATAQPILKQDELDSTEYEHLDGTTETGVEKGEQEEFHLQQALAASSGGTAEEIPAPPAQESADVDYDSLYPLIFKPTASYIRFSQTVEECTGCQYDMTTEDDIFLKGYNQKRSASGKLSEDDFERIMEAFEETASVQTPYASVDQTVLPLETMQQGLKQHVSPKLCLVGPDIYEYWKLRRKESNNAPLQPSLKFEKNQEVDDGDPYVCFRRRDARQTRKTRNRDQQSNERLRKLRKELEDGRQLVQLAYAREVTKRDLLKIDKDIFEQRIKFKEVKVKMGIKQDEDDLINQRPQKRKLSEIPPNQRPPGSQLRPTGRIDGRPIDTELALLSEVLAQKENAIANEIEEKSEAHRKWNLGHVDLTREPLSPVDGQDPSFRPATAKVQYLLTPPSSETSESDDHMAMIQEEPEPFSFRYISPPPEQEHRRQSAYRRRIGRGGRLWIDRRGMPPAPKGIQDTSSDRWKYDQEDDDDQPVYELDPHDLKALRFRASIPLPSHLYHQRPPIGRGTASPVANRVPSAAQAQAQAQAQVAAPAQQQQAPT